MSDYMEYIKCADVLISPSLDYKDQYILKCSECDDCFNDIDSLIQHYFNHQYEDAILEEKSVSGSIDATYEGGDENETDVQENVTIKYEYLSEETDDMDHLPLIGFGKTEYIIEIDNGTCQNSADENDNDYQSETCIINYSESDEESDSEDSKTTMFVRNFMANKSNVATLISAYKKQPFLWNTNNSSQVRAKERPKCLSRIAEEIKQKLDLTIASKEIAAVITRLRHDYREKLKRINNERGDNGKGKNVRMWYFEQLDFLQPYMESSSIYKLDSQHTQLEQGQIVQILNIYKSLPILWNTDLIENVCSNKRLEALAQMQNLFESEMGIKTNVAVLKKYIHCLHMFFTREKRFNMSKIPSTRVRATLYKHMQFLYDHVGPFKCSQCQRPFLSPLNFKVHISEHNDSIPLKCSLCSKQYKTTDAYMAHARRHMNDLKNECKECGKKFSRPADLEIHQRCHTGSKPYCCEICGASYRHSQAFNTHKRRHLKQYLHHCPICSKGFYKKDQMNNHVRTHADVREFKCKLCAKGFKTKKTMQQHMFTHEEGRNHACPVCEKTFKNKLGLAQHIKIHRKNELVESDVNSS